MSERVCGHPEAALNSSIRQKAEWKRLSASQTSAKIDVSSLDLAKLMQEFRPWNGRPINTECAECHKTPATICYQCDQCPGYFICLACMLTLETPHAEHSFITIQYRPLSAPTIDGSELALLYQFKQVQTEKEFYLYFPFFFDDFGGFREVRDANLPVLLAALESAPNSDPQLVRGIRESFEGGSVDAFIRSFGQGDFQPIFQEMQPLVDERMSQARMTEQLHDLYQRLRGLVESFRVACDGKDIPYQDDPSLQIFTNPDSKHWSDPQWPYILYSLGLDLPTFNDQVDMENLIPVLLETVQDTNQDSLGPDLQLLRAYNVICQDCEGFSEYIVYTIGGVVGYPTAHILKRPRLNFIKRSQNIKDLCNSAFKSEIPLIPDESLNVLLFSALDRTTLEDSGDQDLLQTCIRQRRLGDFHEALRGLTRLDAADPAVVFEKLRTYLDQGYLKKAKNSCVPVINLEEKVVGAPIVEDTAALQTPSPETVHATNRLTESDSLSYSKAATRSLLRLVYCYLSCSTHGLWEQALEYAEEVYTQYLSEWRTPDDTESSTLIYLEIFYHKIYMAAYRDFGIQPDYRNIVRRLRFLREYLQDIGRVPEAYDVIVLELELSKIGIRKQYLKQEGALTLRGYVHKPHISLPIIQSFLASSPLKGQRHQYVEEGYMRLLAAELLRESGAQFSAELAAAESIFKSCGSSAGLLDVEFFRIAEKPRTELASTDALYRSLRARDDITRMQRVRRLGVAVASGDEKASSWQETQRDALADLAHEAGDAYSYAVWELRKYASDFMAASVIETNEKIFDTAHEVQSELLATIATYNLSRAYLVQGNTLDAIANAMLHFQLTIKQQDAEQMQRAVLNVLECLEEEFDKKPASRQSEILNHIANGWTGILADDAVVRWVGGHPRCDEIDRFIDGALFLPKLAGRIADGNRGRPGRLDLTLSSTIVKNLHLAFALCEALPQYFASLVLPKLSSALASAAVYCGNDELAVLTYSESLRCCHSADASNISSLRGHIGARLTRMALHDPEQWLHVLAAGRSFLRSAQEFYFENSWLSQSVEFGSRVSKTLAESYVTEARNRKLLWHQDKEVELLAEMLVNVVPLAWDSINRALTRIWALRRQCIGLAPLETMRNKRFLSSAATAQRFYDLSTELFLIVEDVETSEDGLASRVMQLWKTIQFRKAAALYDTMGVYATPGYLLAEITADPRASSLYNKEQQLMERVRHAQKTMRLSKVQRDLTVHQLEMYEDPLLKSLIEKRLGLGAKFEDLHCMAELSRRQFSDTSQRRDLIFVDWLQYHDFFLVLAYNASSASFLFCELIRDFTVRDAERWVNEHIKEPQRKNRENPRRREKVLPYNVSLSDLHPLVKPIHKAVETGDVLVFLPTGILNSVPLHAIPFGSTDDNPVIKHNPVIYCPSNAVMRDCVDRAEQLCAASSPWKGVFYGHLHTDTSSLDPEEGSIIEQSLKALAEKFGDGIAVAVTGLSLTRDTFSKHLLGSNLVHFHGHTRDERVDRGPINRGLQIEPLPLEDAQNRDYYRQLWYEAGFHCKDTGIFSTEDIFRMNLNSSLVTLMACSSSEQNISRSDDPIGLVSAFLVAGASSVIGTLWPVESADARAFSEVFYRKAFLSKPAPIANLAVTMQEAILTLRGDNPEHPFRWAPFVLHGSWFTKGISKAGRQHAGISLRQLLGRSRGLNATGEDLEGRQQADVSLRQLLRRSPGLNAAGEVS